MYKENTLSIMFAGDFAPVRRYEPMILKMTKGRIFGDLMEDIKDSDIAYLNLESPLCTSSQPIKKSGPALCGKPECIASVKEAGFSMVGLANNHIMDYGPEGLEETISACKSNELITFGAGPDLNSASRHLLLVKKGIKLAFIAVTEHEFSLAGINKAGAAPLDPIDNIRQIERAKKEADLVFILIHGGNEYFPLPRPGLRKICHFYAENGADAVICNHVHVPGAYEFHNEKPIVYSLGNLIFDTINPTVDWIEGYAVKLTFNCTNKKLKECAFIPYRQSVFEMGIKKLNGNSRDLFMSKLRHYNEIINNEENYLNEWDHFCESAKNDTLLKMFFPFKFKGVHKMFKYFKLNKLIFPNSSIPDRTNMICCESHHELISYILEKEILKS